MVKHKDYSIQELTQREISRVNNDEKLNKIKRDNSRYKRNMLKYKQNEKVLNKKISMLEEKINSLKETSIGSLFSLTETINDIKESFLEFCDGFSTETEKVNFKSFASEFDYISDFVINVCNTIELNSKMSNYEDKFEDEEDDEEEEYDYSSEIDDIYESEEEEESYEDESNYDFQWDFNQTNRANIMDNNFASEKLHKIFYEAPSETVRVSNNLQMNNGLFDFNEALNPTMSLNDIMSDLVPNSMNQNMNMDYGMNTFNNGLPNNFGMNGYNGMPNGDYETWFMTLQNMVNQNNTEN